jgi:hypothetical protein
LGIGALIRNVVASIAVISFLPMNPPNCLSPVFGTRSKLNTTSSAVKGDPSCHFTPSRSLISQVKSSSAFHEAASAGVSLPSSKWTR